MNRFVFTILLSVIAGSTAASTVVGTVYPVTERDPTLVIKERIGELDMRQLLTRKKQSFRKRMQSEFVPRTNVDRVRSHVPFYTVEHDVLDANGAVIYPQGYVYNPLEYFKMPNAIFVIDEEDINWVKERANTKDMILVNRGDIQAVMKGLQRVAYVLDDNTRTRLDVQSVPSRIRQQDAALMIEESVNAH